MGHAELTATEQSLACSVAEYQQADRPTREVVDLLDGSLLRMVRDELAQRNALYQGAADVADPHDRTTLAWASMAERVRNEADIVHLLRLAGCQLDRAGCGEWCGPCPFCGGRDRFRVWDRDSGGHPRYWCRRCNSSGDAIAAFREVVQPTSSFFEALRWMGLELGIYETPDFGSAMAQNDSPQMIPSREKRRGNNPRRATVRFEQGRAVAS